MTWPFLCLIFVKSLLKLKVQKVCEFCENDFEVDHWRKDTAKFCGRECSDASKKAEDNTICTQCGNSFHIKQSQKNRYSRTHGYFCSRECHSDFKKEVMQGEGNHQFGLKGDKNSSFKGYEIPKNNHNLIDYRVYKPDHPFCDKEGRVLKHRLKVERFYFLFKQKYFLKIGDKKYLRPDVHVHHKDNNHCNNRINNLEPLTISEHTSLHNKNKTIVRDEKGRISKIIINGN